MEFVDNIIINTCIDNLNKIYNEKISIFNQLKNVLDSTLYNNQDDATYFIKNEDIKISQDNLIHITSMLNEIASTNKQVITTMNTCKEIHETYKDLRTKLYTYKPKSDKFNNDNKEIQVLDYSAIVDNLFYMNDIATNNKTVSKKKEMNTYIFTIFNNDNINFTNICLYYLSYVCKSIDNSANKKDFTERSKLMSDILTDTSIYSQKIILEETFKKIYSNIRKQSPTLFNTIVDF